MLIQRNGFHLWVLIYLHWLSLIFNSAFLTLQRTLLLWDTLIIFFDHCLIIPIIPIIPSFARFFLQKSNSSRPKTSGAVLGGLHARAPQPEPNAEKLMGRILSISEYIWVYTELLEMLEGTWISSWSCPDRHRSKVAGGNVDGKRILVSTPGPFWERIDRYSTSRCCRNSQLLLRCGRSYQSGAYEGGRVMIWPLFASPRFALLAPIEMSHRNLHDRTRLQERQFMRRFSKCFRARNPRRMKPFRCRHLLGLPWRDWYLCRLVVSIKASETHRMERKESRIR